MAGYHKRLVVQSTRHDPTSHAHCTCWEETGKPCPQHVPGQHRRQPATVSSQHPNPKQESYMEWR